MVIGIRKTRNRCSIDKGLEPIQSGWVELRCKCLNDKYMRPAELFRMPPLSYRLQMTERLISWGLVVLAGSFAAAAWQLDMGQLARPGPGAFPLLISLALLLLGGSLAIRPEQRTANDEPEPLHAASVRAFVSTVAGVLVFAVVVRAAGLIPATFCTLIAVASADHRLSWRNKLTLAAGVSVFAWLLFIVVLGMPVVAMHPRLF